jgi:hypothetical protein
MKLKLNAMRLAWKLVFKKYAKQGCPSIEQDQEQEKENIFSSKKRKKMKLLIIMRFDVNARIEKKKTRASTRETIAAYEEDFSNISYSDEDYKNMVICTDEELCS